MKVCFIEVDLEENQNPKPELDEGEFVETILVDKSDLLKILEEFSAKGVSIDAKLYTYAMY
jgi:ADP-ribose pyrophosphatase